MAKMRALKPTSTPPPEFIFSKPKACTACRARKVKCDRATPCGTCTSWNIPCSYPPPKRFCRRPAKKLKLPSPSNHETKNHNLGPQVLDDAFRKLLIEAMGAPGSSRLTTMSTEAIAEMQDVKDSLEKTLSLAAGWATKYPHLTVPFAPLLRSRNSLFDTLGFPSITPFAEPTPNMDTTLHPSPTIMKTYQRIFFSKIDPLIKVLHRTTVTFLLSRALREPSALTPSELSVVFSIYLASLCAMSSTEAFACCGVPKQTAMATYKGAVEHALAGAKLGETEDLTAMQGFVLYLGLHRFFTDKEPGAEQSWKNRTWAYAGFASRLASTTLCDTTGKSPFENEMRKRLHLALWYLEHRAREDLGRNVCFPPWNSSDSDLAIFPHTSLPTNAADSTLHPHMTSPPVPRQGWTEISFTLMQMEIATATRMVRTQGLTVAYKEAVIESCETRVRQEYLRYCDGALEAHWLAKHVAHVLIMELRFEVYGCGDSFSMAAIGMPSQYAGLVENAMDMLDVEERARHDEDHPQAKQWGWLLTEYLQFWPLVFLLGHLCSPALDIVLADRAWQVAERSFRRWGGPEHKTSGNSYFETLRQLWIQAQGARTRDLLEFPVSFSGALAGATGEDATWHGEEVDGWVGLECADVCWL